MDGGEAAAQVVQIVARFANYRTWLSSDTMLSALGIDPDATQKRLGDGFYEQQLLREQVGQLTGRRFLDGYANDEAQYQALMNSGVTYAQAHQLRPGVSLSAEQMAQLTSDIVWLVEKTVTLKDGSTTKVLAPQLYVRVREGDLATSGALISGDSVHLNVSGDLSNSGTIAGRRVVNLNAENVHNLGGRISGADVGVQARNDLNNLGGSLTASSSLTATAGRDLKVISTTRTESTEQSSNTNIGRVAGLYVTGANGTLVAHAGRDLQLNAAAILNSAPTGAIAGSTTLTAGRDLNLGVVTESTSHHIVWDANNQRSDASRTDIGTTIQTQGDIRLQAGGDLNAKAANVSSAQGAVLATAGGSVKLTTGQARVQVDETHQQTSKGLFSSKTTRNHDTLDQTAALGSTLSGNTTTVLANQDIQVQGSNVVSTQGTLLAAQNNVTVEAAKNTKTESHLNDEKLSGLFGTGGIGFTVGTRQQSVNQDGTTSTAAASTVGSLEGNVSLQAGKNYSQIGSHVLAPQGNIDIAAQKVDITEARDTSQNETETKFKQSGLTLALTSPVITAIQTAQQMSKAAGQTSDSRMQLLAGASTAMAGLNAYGAVQAGQGSTINGKSNQIATTDAAGKPTSRDANAADQVGGINVSISIGGSKSQSNTVQTADNAAGSTVAAGGDITIRASGAGQKSDLTVQGSSVKAGHNATLQADDQINLLAAQNTAEQHSSNKNSSASVGIGFALGGTQNGFSINVGVSGGRGNADGSDVGHANTRVEAGNRLSINSGGDTTLKGAVAKADQVTADIGGNLHIESLQDTSQYDSKQKSVSAGVSLCIPPFCYGASSGSVNASKSKVNSNYASVTEQSSIKAGDGGFHINVAGNTDLKGGAITSSDNAVANNKNSFNGNTAEGLQRLSLSDINNQASFSAQSTAVTVGNSGGSAGIGQDRGNTASTTVASISGIAGNKAARTADAETGIQKIFDATKVNDEMAAQVAITSEFGKQASKAVGDYAQTKYKKALLEKDAAGIEQWKEGGTSRMELHALVGGLGGGIGGLVGAATSQTLIPKLGEELATLDVPVELKNTLIQIAGMAVGAATGGASGAVAGQNATANNYLNHIRPSMLRLSEIERYEAAAASCANGDKSACGARDELAQLSAKRDVELAQACAGSTPDRCNSLAKQASSMGNVLTTLPGGFTYANSPITSALNVATIGAPTRPDSFHDQAARSTAEAVLLEVGNQAVGALVGVAVKGLGATSTAVNNFFASQGIAVTEGTTARIVSNFGRDGDSFTIAAEQMVAAKNSGWVKPDGNIWWPPGSGNVPGTEFQTTLSVGTKLDRYGGTGPDAIFLAPSGTALEQRALSPTTNIAVRDEYVVIKPLPVAQSNTMPWFGQQGMGVQFDTAKGLGMKIEQLVRMGYLQRVKP